MRRLIADIGGTNARFALAETGGLPEDEQTLQVADYADMALAIETYLAGRRVEAAVMAVATPVESDLIRFTNSPWTFSIEGLRTRLGLSQLDIINDFAAQALAMPHLAPAELEQIGGGAPTPGRAIGVLGPGTGLGVSSLVPGKVGWTALPGEGGHVTFAPASEREWSLKQALDRRFGHVSNERLLSGQGLLNLAHALAELDGGTCAAATPRDVTDAARAGSCAACVEAVALFSAILGSAAGDLALITGARGGVFVAGGICLRMGELFDRAAFRRRFEAKGRMRVFLEPIPVWLVLRGDTGLMGAAHYRSA